MVRLGFSNLADLVPRALGAYDLQLSYDPALLRLDAVHFGDPLYGDQLDLSGFGTWSLSDAAIPGMVRVLELSFDDASLLNSAQRRHFGLASLFFQAQSAGTSPLTVQVNMLADAGGFPMEGSTMNGAVTVTPEPGMFVLAGTGLAALGVWRRKRYFPRMSAFRFP